MKFPCEVALRGAVFYEAAAHVTVGDKVVVRHEDDNPHDPNAFAARFQGEVIGHLPAPIAQRLCAEHGTTVAVTATVAFFRPEPRFVRLVLDTPTPLPTSLKQALSFELCNQGVKKDDHRRWLAAHGFDLEKLSDPATPLSTMDALALSQKLGGTPGFWLSRTDKGPSVNATGVVHR